MDKLKKLLTQLVIFIDNSLNDLEEILKSADKPVNSCINLGKILGAVLKDNKEKKTALSKFEGFHDALINNLYTEIGNEVKILENLK